MFDNMYKRESEIINETQKLNAANRKSSAAKY
jgi:hypothetical protein